MHIAFFITDIDTDNDEVVSCNILNILKIKYFLYLNVCCFH